MIITPVPRTHERNAMRFPLCQKAIDLSEQMIGIAAAECAIAAEDPHARGIR